MTIALDGTLVLLGAGKMGGAMLDGWLANGLDAKQVAILDPGPPPEVAELIDRNAIALNPDIASIEDAGIVIIAIKPQMMADVLPSLKPLTGAKPTFLSIAAGTTISTFEEHFGADAAIVRAMPNTPASVGHGMTVICPNANVPDDKIALCETLLSAVGDVARIDDEADLDAVTAVSGSGPAYVFLLAEVMAEAGIAAGLDEALATRLARTTVHGAGELLRRSDLPAATLRENVTSPGGTTAAALAVLREDDAMKRLFEKAVAAAAQRGRELAG